MPPVPAPSNIRAFVNWREPAVYAGEEIECIITFHNIAKPPGQAGREELRTVNGGQRAGRASNAQTATGSRRASIAQTKGQTSKAPSVASTRGGPPSKRGHRPTLSLNVVSATSSRSGLQSAPIQRPRTPSSAVKPNRGHGRSLSIMSLGSEAPSEVRPLTAVGPPKRPGKGHVRSASLQYPSKSSPQNTTMANVMNRQPSPLYESTTPPDTTGKPLSLKPTRQKPPPTSTLSQTKAKPSLRRNHSTGVILPDFKFPAQPPDEVAPTQTGSPPKPIRTPSTMHSGQHRGVSPKPPDGWSGPISNLNPISRVMSNSSVSGTPRTSSEFYSMSNHSEETLMSDLPQQAQQGGRLIPRPTFSRQASQIANAPIPAEPEILMMGFARTVGQFTLDGSLVNAAPFEEVKRKGVQGGGGVIGVERSKRTSGMFGAFSWGNIGESLGGLLGNDEMSSMAQMKASAGSKAVPLLSTPQSLLFVDLKLAPGESRSYSYKFALPRGLPPSHKGRAIKVNYHLSIGVQRPGGQPVKNVEIPFRVLGSYNARGEVLGHDLMTPYILLQDAARTTIVPQNAPNTPSLPVASSNEAQVTVKTPKQGLEDFLRYTERLLEQPADSNNALLSPTSPVRSRQHSIVEQTHSSIKEAIDFAVLRSNFVGQSGNAAQSEVQSANRFNIARSGQPVAVLTLLRPAFKLGESVIGVLDFTAPAQRSDVPDSAITYAVLAELESAERIDASLALRSNHSVHRVTRKVHASVHENAAFARQIAFNLTIPAHATPSFETTGVSVVWTLRVEFTTKRAGTATNTPLLDGSAGGTGENGFGDGHATEGLLEEIGSDERGTTLIAREHLMAETFEIAVPLKVYGAPGIEGVGFVREALEV